MVIDTVPSRAEVIRPRPRLPITTMLASSPARTITPAPEPSGSSPVTSRSGLLARTASTASVLRIGVASFSRAETTFSGRPRRSAVPEAQFTAFAEISEES